MIPTTTSTQAAAAPYVWTMQTGERIPVTKMATSHLFYTVRMIFNHTCPAIYRIPGCKRYDLHLDTAQRREAIYHICRELSLRPREDLEGWQWVQLLHIAETINKMNRKELN